MRFFDLDEEFRICVERLKLRYEKPSMVAGQISGISRTVMYRIYTGEPPETFSTKIKECLVDYYNPSRDRYLYNSILDRVKIPWSDQRTVEKYRGYWKCIRYTITGKIVEGGIYIDCNDQMFNFKHYNEFTNIEDLKIREFDHAGRYLLPVRAFNLWNWAAVFRPSVAIRVEDPAKSPMYGIVLTAREDETVSQPNTV